MRKIIHVDMDCFFAAVEIRDNPSLRNKPIAVGGGAGERGVICTCNYIARQYGVHSAMATAHALKLCPDLIVIAPRFHEYRKVADAIRDIFYQFTSEVEPLSLDEAFLDVTDCEAYFNSATLIAKAIRQKIFATHQLTASAGVAPNKFLAKVGSNWRKPNGQFVISPEAVDVFVKVLPVSKISGVGKVTSKKLADLGVQTCLQLQRLSIKTLVQHFGSFGIRLYELSRGIDQQLVNTDRIRKSLSVEETFISDLHTLADCLKAIDELYAELTRRLKSRRYNEIKKQFIKIKFSDFTQSSVECVVDCLQVERFKALCSEGFARRDRPVRLLGVGVRFAEPDKEACAPQLKLSLI